MVRVLSVAGSFLTLEQQLQQNGNGYRRYHDKQYDRQEVPLFHHADRKSLVRDYQRDLSSGHHSNADPQGILPAVAERLRDKPAADDLSDKSNHNESQREPQQINSESVERDVKTNTCKEHRPEQHVGADIHFARDILSVAEVAENYSRNICAGDVCNAEERLSAVSHQEAQHQSEYRDTALMVELLVQELEQEIHQEAHAKASPVDFISGPKTVSTLRNFANENTGALTKTLSLSSGWYPGVKP